MAKKNARASDAALSALHAALANEFTNILTNGRKVVNKETGELEAITPDASTLNAIRQFLKDNDITALAESSPDMAELVDRAKLPFQPQADEHGLPN